MSSEEWANVVDGAEVVEIDEERGLSDQSLNEDKDGDVAARADVGEYSRTWTLAFVVVATLFAMTTWFSTNSIASALESEKGITET